MAQVVKVHEGDTVESIAVDIQSKINQGHKVISCNYIETPEEFWKHRALVVYEKEDEPSKSSEMSTGMDWSNCCILKTWPHESKPESDIDINVSPKRRKIIRDSIEKRFGPGSTGID